MSITDLQNKPIIVGNPIEIDFAVNEIRTTLATLSFIDKPYFIAQRFVRKSNGRTFVYPETYSTEKPGSRNYVRVTPDNDFKGAFFFLVGPERNEFEPNQMNYLSYDVAIIFSVNLELINSDKLDQGLFTQELIRAVRRLLTETMINHEFEYTIKTVTRDLKEVYKEFVLDDIEQYNRAPLQCFRFDLIVKIREDCPVPAAFLDLYEGCYKSEYQ